jgi:hypothetical protein
VVALLVEDAVGPYLDRVGQVLVIWLDKDDGAAFARITAMALDFVTIEPEYDDSIAHLEIAHSNTLASASLHLASAVPCGITPVTRRTACCVAAGAGLK